MKESQDKTSAPALAHADFAQWPTYPAANPAELRAALPQAPQAPGVYAFFDAAGAVLYVGKALALRRRLVAYARLDRGLSPGDVRLVTVLLFKTSARVGWQIAASETEALITEAALIRRHQPRLNMRLRDDHGHTYVGFSRDACPRIFLARAPAGREPDSEAHPGAEYVGPFSDARALRRTLDALRRVFPFVTHPGSPRSCLEYELGLCPLAPGRPSTESAAACRRGARALRTILAGESRVLARRWRAEMRRAAKINDFERAARRRDDLAALARVTGTI